MKNITLKKILLVIFYTILLIFLFINISPILSFLGKVIAILAPLITGFILAYMMNVPYKLFYRHVFKKTGSKRPKLKKLKKPLSMICSYVIVLGFITVILIILIPKISESLSALMTSIPSYAAKAANWISDQVAALDKMFGLNLESSADFKHLIESLTGTKLENLISQLVSWAFPTAYTTILSTATGIYNVVLGVIFSIYLLASKDTLKYAFNKFFRAYLPDRPYFYIRKVAYVSDQKCGKYLTGKIIEIVIMGILYFVVFSIIGFHYSTLIAFIMTLSGLIPFFGPFIGGIPSALVLLIINPWECLWFVVALIVLQQIDGNIIGPKILGNSVGLSGLWVLVSVILFGGLFGVLGMLFGVPVFAVIYALISDSVNTRFDKKTLKTPDNS